MTNKLIFTLVVALAAISAVLLHQVISVAAEGTKQQLVTEPSDSSVPAFSLPDLQGEMRQQNDWDGKVVVFNFWATWCAPCVKEIPLFVETQARHGEQGLQFVGIAIDQLSAVERFAKRFGMNYPVLIGDGADSFELVRNMGNKLGALPFTVIVDRQGEVVLRHAGELRPVDIAEKILPLLETS